MHFIDFLILGMVLVLAFFAVRYCIRHKNCLLYTSLIHLALGLLLLFLIGGDFRFRACYLFLHRRNMFLDNPVFLGNFI